MKVYSIFAVFVILLFTGIAQEKSDQESGGDEKVAEITLNCDKQQYFFDITEFTVKAGQKVKVKLVNPEETVTNQPHNVIFVKPGMKNVVGALANEGVSDPDFLGKKQAVPDSEHVLFYSGLVYPGEEEIVEFTAPIEPGEYPYLCTFPGHWMLMNGVMIVEE